MPWQPLNLNNLPLVLAGPIVRRTTNSLVSVWIALKEKRELVLHVHENDSRLSPSKRVSMPVITSEIAQHLHVALIRVYMSSANKLESGKIYYYDISFGQGQNSLAADNVLKKDGNGIDKIVFSPHKLPSFILPSADINKIKLAHGSCRKPHGGLGGTFFSVDPDAFKSLADYIEKTIGNAPNPTADIKQIRPQLLFLTGDQIYADDVADALLHMIIDAGTKLFGNNYEDLSEFVDDPFDLNPGNRLELLTPHPFIKNKKRFSNDVKNFFSSSEAKSHLIKFEEFCCMYLFAFSDVLWVSDFPDFDAVYKRSEEYYKYFKDKIGDTILESSTDPKAIVNLDINTYIYIESLKKIYSDEITYLTDFKSNVLFARRVLANIITYMVCDDHEITDDWNIRKNWCEEVLKPGRLTRRVIQNGLAAFAVFQGLGNFDATITKTASKYNQLLAYINRKEWSSMDSLLIPFTEFEKGTGQKIKKFYRNEGNSSKLIEQEKFNLSSNLTWDYRVNYENFDIIALDTRSNRSFIEENAPALIDEDCLPKQIGNTPPTLKEFTIVVSGAPIFNKPFVAKILKDGGSNTPFASIAGENLYSIDSEEWEFENYSFQELLHSLSRFKKVVILSGDVHYGFSASIKYWDRRSNPIKPSIMIQLNSSAMKNSGYPYKWIGIKPLESNRYDEPYEYVGWTKDAFFIDPTNSKNIPFSGKRKSPPNFTINSNGTEADIHFILAHTAKKAVGYLIGGRGALVLLKDRPKIRALQLNNLDIKNVKMPNWYYVIDFSNDGGASNTSYCFPQTRIVIDNNFAYFFFDTDANGVNYINHHIVCSGRTTSHRMQFEIPKNFPRLYTGHEQ